MHTDSHEGDDILFPSGARPQRSRERSEEQPGYETQDVNVGGIITFLTGLSGFLVIFFLFCFVMGKAINTGILKEDGPADKWHGYQAQGHGDAGSGALPSATGGRKRENLTSNVVLEQREFANTTLQFPSPRLQTDDGNQDTADMHAREDLLLSYYSTGSGLAAGKVRMPIDDAMALIVKRGLPTPPSGVQTQGTQMAGDAPVHVMRPLTDGFARTGYELDQMTARAQRQEFNQAEAKR